MAQLQSTVVSGNTSTTGFMSAGGRRLSMGILDLNSGATPTQFKIKTTIPWNSGNADFTVNIKGFRYGGGQMVSLSVGWHHYLNTFYNEAAICNGGWAPTITLAKSSDNFVIIHLAGPGYWPKLYVESVYSSAYTDSYSSGWTWSDADLSDCTDVSVVPYNLLACSISGNSATTSQTNFSTLTLNSAAVATQSWVQSQGYLTSVSDVWVNTTGDTMTGTLTIARGQDANVTNLNINSGVTPVSAFQINSDQPNLRSILMARNGYSLILGTQDTNRVTIDTIGNVYTAAGSSISYGSGETYIIWNNEVQYGIVHSDANWKDMKTFKPSKSGSLKFKFSAYISSGTYYWAWRIRLNGTSTVASGHYNSGLDTGEVTSVHAYRRFVASVGPIAAGDSLVLQMISSDGSGNPTTGNGQTLYAKEFRAYSTVPNLEHGGSTNIWGDYVGIGTLTPTRTLHVISSDWDNNGGGGVIFQNSNTVGSGLTLIPTASAVTNGASGWAMYAGGPGAAIGDGNLGFWAHGTNAARLFIRRNGQIAFTAYTASGSFSGTAAGLLGFDSSGNVISIGTGTYLTAESDTLATVTGRGNTTTTRIGVATSTPINFVTAGNAGTWLGGIQDATTGWSISNNGLGLKADDSTYAGIVLATSNGLLYFGRTQASGVGSMTSWLEVSSGLVANFKGSRPQSNGSNLALVSELPTVNNGTLTLAVSGTGLSGSASFTANQSGNTTFTVTSNATSANTASAIVARDASGNFSAGTITAALSGNATTASSSPILSASGSLTTEFGSGTIGYIYAINSATAGLFSTSDNSNAIITINRHPGSYYSQLGFNWNGGLFYRSFNATAINTTQAWQTVWTSTSLTNLNQLSNGPGYITASSTDTLTNKSGNISQWTNNSGYITATNSDFSYAASLTLNTSWQNTGVTATNLSTSGVYIVQCSLNDFGVSGGQYSETYVGLMYWYAGSTNSNNAAEIPLHHSGHADNDRYIYLRTYTDTGGATAKIYLQIKGNGTNSGASTYTFTFKRLL